MRKFKCLIVEDEPLAVEVITEYIGQFQELTLAGVCINAIEAMQVLKHTTVDILFLDIHLPRMSGMDMIRSLAKKPAIVLITAHREYAVEGYELDVADYLLKPVSFSRFVLTVNRIIDRLSSNMATESAPLAREHIYVNVSRKRLKVAYSEIIYLESKREYVNIVTQDGAFLTKIQLSELEHQLDKSRFIRIHRSYIVSKEKIRAYNATELQLATFQLPIGRNYKEQVLAQLSKI